MSHGMRFTLCLSALAALTLVPLTESGPANATAPCKAGQAVVKGDDRVPKYFTRILDNYDKTREFEEYINYDLSHHVTERWAPGTCLTASENIQGWYWKTRSRENEFSIMWKEQHKSFNSVDAHYKDAVWKWFYKASEYESFWFDADNIEWVK